MAHDIVKPSFERKDERGVFKEVLNEGTWEALICGTMKPHSVMGNHYHKETLVFFYISSGSASIRTVHVHTRQRDSFSLAGGHGVFLRTNEAHEIKFLEDSEFVMLKSLKYDPAAPDTFDFPV